MLDADKFGTLTGGHRIWAVAAMLGERERLTALHAELIARLQVRDRLVYLGNYLGYGPDIIGTVDELIAFRSAAMALPGMMPQDIVFLRGAQEEMWHKLLQLQLALSPGEVLSWMLSRGVEATVAAYGGRPQDGMAAARGGTLTLTRWTGQLRDAMVGHPGHRELMSHLKRACVTADGGLLFVHAGLDPERPLETQRDAFWWNPGGFARMAQPFDGFRLVVRGFDPDRAGIAMGEHTATIDGGCGAGGPLVAVCFSPQGQVLDRIEA